MLKSSIHIIDDVRITVRISVQQEVYEVCNKFHWKHPSHCQNNTLAIEFNCFVNKRQNFETFESDLRQCSTIERFLASRYKFHETFHDILISVAERQLKERAQQKLKRIVASHVQKSSHIFVKCWHALMQTQTDCIQWIMKTLSKHSSWSTEWIVHELMTLWFDSVYILSTISASNDWQLNSWSD